MIEYSLLIMHDNVAFRHELEDGRVKQLTVTAIMGGLARSNVCKTSGGGLPVTI